MASRVRDIVQSYSASLSFHSSLSKSVHCGLWEKGIQDIIAANINTNKIVAQTLHVKKDDVVLDAGCGVGGSSIYLAEQYGVRATGISIVPHQIRTAQRYQRQSSAKEKLSFFVQNYFKTTFKKNTFDHVFGIESMCHAVPPRNLLKEMYRVLKPGGTFLSLDGFEKTQPRTPKQKQELNEFLQGFVLNGLNSVANFQAEMKRQGFKNIRYLDKTSQVRPSTEFYYAKCKRLWPFLSILHSLHLFPTAALRYVRSVMLTKAMLDEGLMTYGMIIGEK